MAAGRRPAVWPRDAAIDRPAMDDLKATLARPIQLAEQVIKFADEARTRQHQCQDLKARVERVATMLRQAARADLYERPARRVLADVETALDRTGALLYRCRRRATDLPRRARDVEKGAGDVRYNSAMALLQICRVAERNAELRPSEFKPTSPAARAVVDQLVRVVDRADHDDELLVPCVTSLGCLSRTFRATETRVIIGPLVRFLDDREDEVIVEAAVALAKFACVDNYLHAEHSRAIVEHGGARHLVQLGCFREQPVQTPALVLVCYIVHNIPDSEELAQAGILTLLEWASKQGCTAHDPVIENLLPEAKIRMELFQSRGAAKVYY